MPGELEELYRELEELQYELDAIPVAACREFTFKRVKLQEKIDDVNERISLT